jgi:hypothetical protein
MTEDRLNYQSMIEGAMKGVVRQALMVAADTGLPGAHHFYITFRTRAPGVEISNALLAQYPEEMTIVLQNKFWDLAVGEASFTVTLTFGGRPERLVVPFPAVTRFVDPAVQFALQFEAPRTGPVAVDAPAKSAVPAVSPQKGAAQPAEPEPEPPPGANVVTLDRFRKK